MTDDLELMKIGKTIDRRVRCLLVYCARCELQVLRVERDERDRNPPFSMTNGALWTLGGLHVRAQGAATSVSTDRNRPRCTGRSVGAAHTGIPHPSARRVPERVAAT